MAGLDAATLQRVLASLEGGAARERLVRALARALHEEAVERRRQRVLREYSR